MGAWLDAGDAVVSVFYPAGWRLCDQLLKRAIRLPIGEECLASCAPLPSPVCDICGSPVVTPFALNALKHVEVAAGQEASIASARFETNRRGCLGCLGRTFAFERARSYAACEGRLIRAIVSSSLSGLSHSRFGSPSDWRTCAKRAARGATTKSSFIARPWARKLGLPYRAVLRMRTKPRPDKHTLSLSESLGAGPWRFCHTTGQPS